MSSSDFAEAPPAADAESDRADGSRREDREVLTGERRYAGDRAPENALHAAVYRSPHAHARIDRVDLTAALALDGVVGGWTGETLPPFVGPMSGPEFPNLELAPLQDGTDEENPKIRGYGHYPLARDKVRFVGEPVAVVVAEDRYVAEDAVDRVVAEYDLLDPVLDEVGADEEGSPLVYEGWDDNRLLEFEVEGGDVDGAFADAAHVVEEEIRHHRFTGTPMEPRAVVATYDADERRVSMHDSTQKPHLIARRVASSLDVAGLTVDIDAENVGGGFGVKTGYYPEDLLIPALAVEFGRPVKWVERRQEHLVASIHAREQTHRLRVAVAADGEILALEDDIFANSGAAYPHAGLAAHVTTAQFVPGTYAIEHFRCSVRGMATNKAPFGAHRGFGKAESMYVIERLAKIVADELGMDPAEFRQRNFIRPEQFPYRSATGSNYDSGNYPEALRRAQSLAGYDEWRTEQADRRASEDRMQVGVGIAACVEPSSAARRDSASTPGYYAVRMEVDPTGHVHVYPEDPDLGTSHEASILTIVSRELSVDEERISVVQGDTRACPYGSGSYSSRFSVVGTSACYEAAARIAERLQRIAGAYLDEPTTNLVLDSNAVRSRETGRTLTLEEVAHVAYSLPHRLPDGMDPGIELTHYFRAPNIDFEVAGKGRASSFSSHPYAADVAVVEVDTETGLFEIREYATVHDCGTILNEKVVEGQHLGALAHGFGGAMLENLPYDEAGNPVHQTFVDYAIPSAKEIPEVTMDHLETPSPFTPGGHKGTGETGTVSVPPALTNAVEDALAPFGVRIRDPTPMTPAYVWERIREARSD